LVPRKEKAFDLFFISEKERSKIKNSFFRGNQKQRKFLLEVKTTV